MSETPPAPESEELPHVAMPQRRWVMPLAVLAAVGIGVLVFMQMNANRMRQQQAAQAPPQLDEPYQSLNPVPFPQVVTSAPPIGDEPGEPAAMAPAISAPNSASARLQSPALVVDLSTPAAPGERGATPDPAAVSQAVVGDLSGNERYAARLGGAAASARARPGRDARSIVPEGVLIAAVLETAVNSDLPGYARAMVSRDVKSFDGSRVLVPRGSRLVGQYRSAVSLGQSRAFVIWTRLIRPDGVSVQLGDPGTDALGRGGLEGRVDTHFLRRFGGAMMLSLLSAGVSAAASDSDTQIIIAGARGVGDTAAGEIGRDFDIQPTVDVAPGTPIRVFVTRDLDFSGVAAP